MELLAQTQTPSKSTLCTFTIYVVGGISHFTKTFIKVSTVLECHKDRNGSKVNHLTLLGK